MYTKMVGMREAGRWFAGGWRLYALAPRRWLIATLAWTSIAAGLTLMFSFVGILIGSLLFPIAYAGYLVGARELQHGRVLTVGHVFRGLSTPSIILSLLFLGLLPIGFTFALVISAVYLGTIAPAVLVVAPLGILSFLALLYACPLVIFAGIGPWLAMKSSYDACGENLGALMVIILILLSLAMATVATFGLGLLVTMPVGFCTLYLSYTSIYGQS